MPNHKKLGMRTNSDSSSYSSLLWMCYESFSKFHDPKLNACKSWAIAYILRANFL